MNSQDTARLLRQRRERRSRAKGGASKVLLQLFGGLVVLLLSGFVLTILGGIASATGIYGYYAKDLPDPGEIVTRQEKFETTKIYDRTGKVLLMEVIDPRRGDRTLLPLEQIPEAFRNATIALEDKTFYSNIGIDPQGIVRAFMLNLQGKGVQGGSSITVQLVKNILISEEERYEISYARKIKEAILALEISRLFQGPDPGVVPEHELLWQLGHRRRGRFASLLWQARPGTDPGRVRHAGAHRPVPGHEPH
jgi:membrane peptidoglycan carboxypeptidase